MGYTALEVHGLVIATASEQIVVGCKQFLMSLVMLHLLAQVDIDAEILTMRGSYCHMDRKWANGDPVLAVLYYRTYSWAAKE